MTDPLLSNIEPSDCQSFKEAKLQRWLKQACTNAGISPGTTDPLLSDITGSESEGIRWAKLGRWAALLANNSSGNIAYSGSQSLTASQQAQARVRSVFRKGDGDGKTLEADESSDPLRRQMLSDNPSAVRELLERWQIALEDWQRKVDDRVHGVVESLSPFAALEKEVTRLQKRVDELEARLTPASPPEAQ